MENEKPILGYVNFTHVDKDGRGGTLKIEIKEEAMKNFIEVVAINKDGIRKTMWINPLFVKNISLIN